MGSEVETKFDRGLGREAEVTTVSSLWTQTVSHSPVISAPSTALITGVCSVCSRYVGSPMNGAQERKRVLEESMETQAYGLVYGAR